MKTLDQIKERIKLIEDYNYNKNTEDYIEIREDIKKRELEDIENEIDDLLYDIQNLKKYIIEEVENIDRYENHEENDIDYNIVDIIKYIKEINLLYKIHLLKITEKKDISEDVIFSIINLHNYNDIKNKYIEIKREIEK